MVKELFESIPSRTVPARPKLNYSRSRRVPSTSIPISPYGLAAVHIACPDTIALITQLEILADVLDSRRGNLYD